jgi:hypothetical protein
LPNYIVIFHKTHHTAAIPLIEIYRSTQSPQRRQHSLQKGSPAKERVPKTISPNFRRSFGVKDLMWLLWGYLFEACLLCCFASWGCCWLAIATQAEQEAIWFTFSFNGKSRFYDLMNRRARAGNAAFPTPFATGEQAVKTPLLPQHP